MLKYARLWVEMAIDGNFAAYVEFANERDVLIRPKVKYEWLTLKCTHYRMFGHTQENCKNKDIQRKEWRVKAQAQP